MYIYVIIISTLYIFTVDDTVNLRRLEIILRQTEILYSLYKLKLGNATPPFSTKDLSTGRETLSWLLHHDAITGMFRFIV